MSPSISERQPLTSASERGSHLDEQVINGRGRDVVLDEVPADLVGGGFAAADGVQKGTGILGEAGRPLPSVYLRFGDGPTTYADPYDSLALANAIRWVANGDARDWAALSA